MSVTIRELSDSRNSDLNAKDGSSDWHFEAVTTGETNPENAVYVALLTGETYAPYVWNNLLRGRPKITPQGNNRFDVHLPYVQAVGLQTSDPGGVTPPGGQPPQPPPPSPAATDLINNGVQIDVGGKPPRIYRSLKTISRTSPPGKTAPDFDRYILVAPDGKSEGLEAPEPAVVLTLSLTFTYMTWGYLDRLSDTCWRTNDKPFAGRTVGELLLMGASGHVEKNGLVPMTFKFGVDKGETIEYATSAAGAALTVDRGPWEFAWFAYGVGKDPLAVTAQPVGVELRGVYVERIFKPADYTALGIFA